MEHVRRRRSLDGRDTLGQDQSARRAGPPLGNGFSRERARAITRSSQVSVDYNALRGTGNFGAGTARSWIVTPTLDAEVHRSIALQCNAYENRCSEPRLTQSAKLVSPASRTSLTVQSQVSRDGVSGVSRIGVEQNFGNLRLGAAVADPLLAPRSVVDVRYSLKW